MPAHFDSFFQEIRFFGSAKNKVLPAWQLFFQ